ncbi:hypothetical protein JOJ87_001430 [Rhodococcus ruber]|uniref:hypothetical protein n=1 Tax=Rhodococcus ruber TaxID=1830 RepID=UPI001AE8898B|nr:hypothetical protein [Rhodococcus ruber]MBP2211086.1 hypothetical protein [Rhodococcus ruber]
MAELVVFPDLEPTLVGYLTAELAARSITATVATKVPRERPATMVRISGTGGSRRNALYEDSGALVECWAANEVAASGLARIVRALVDDLDVAAADGGWITANGTSTPVFFPEPDVTSPRYQFTAQFLTQGQILA